MGGGWIIGSIDGPGARLAISMSLGAAASGLDSRLASTNFMGECISLPGSAETPGLRHSVQPRYADQA
jgi:hypothetical protein